MLSQQNNVDMKTKFIAILISLSGLIYGQDWSPVGAEWYYDITYASMGDIEYHKVYCDSIINIKGKECKKINIDFVACNNHFNQKIYTYNNQDTIYFYNPDIDDFEVLYNFNSKQGDSWQIKTKDRNNIIDTVVVSIDSIGTKDINGKKLKELFVSYKYNYKLSINQVQSYQESSTILESLGDLNFIININDKYRGVCDINFIHSLRCYEDTVLGFYSSGLRDSCTYSYKWTSINSNQTFNYLYVYPNPTDGILLIHSEYKNKTHYDLFDLNGFFLKSGDETKLNLFSISRWNLFIAIDS